MGKNAGPYSIGSESWPGASRIIEECGELLQVLGKLIGSGGSTAHWDGTDLGERLADEISDTRAALDYFISANNLPADVIDERTARKRAQYEKWHEANQ
ncbi:hypothetical protein [Myceligenerans salitolerans]|uniref:NTP pyrophosphohydrolase MazG putative catalytic core domain-containing protein n=1 Tax=Myceligenerans salitolerans TaxID=1230528 RepID=A0ABS3ICW7_9MICO|nr:hypothetical protein [Myceligenerans salitolerans]MBO0610879.1 hypothetical protein [Myceligenerans salitolerans]